MTVFELALRICFTSPLPYEQATARICGFIDRTLAETGEYLKQYKSCSYKAYTFDLPYPLEETHIYEEGKLYQVRIRTVSEEMASFFLEKLSYCAGSGIQSLEGELRVIPRGMIDCVHSLTPVVMKTSTGYWRNEGNVREYGLWLKDNLVRKYNFFSKTEISGDFQLYRKIEFKNKVPVRASCKNVTLLGDKVHLTASENRSAQELLYMALGTGLGNNNTRGCGFLTYRFRKENRQP